MAVKWNGRMIANLMRKSKLEWNSGSVARFTGNGKERSHCAVGQLGRLLGASAEAVARVGNHPSDREIGHVLSNIFYVNDGETSKEAAANAVERVYGDTVFYDVAEYESNLREAQKLLFRMGYTTQADLEPDCELLEAVKREEEEFQRLDSLTHPDPYKK